MLASTLRHWVRFILLAFLIVIITVAAMFPLALGLGALKLFAPALGEAATGLVAMVLLWVVIWLRIYFYFTAAAVVLANQGVLQAPLLSMALLRHHFWSALGFIGISIVLTGGFELIWMGMDGSAVGRAVSILGNAALGTSIVAATFIFFAQRYQLLLKRVRARKPATGNDG